MIEEFETTMGIFGWRDEINDDISSQEPFDKEFDEEKIQKIILERYNARQIKDWKKADNLRLEAEKLGINLKDTKDGTNWRKND